MDWSIEILPRQTHQLHLIPDFVQEVYIPSLPGSKHRNLASASKKLIEFGKIPVPHIAARSLESQSEVRNLLADLVASKVDRVLLIGGSVSQPAGPYSSVMDLMNTGILSEMGIDIIDVAGHPEGNPYDVKSEDHLLEKVAWATKNDVKLRIVTQWSFNAIAINDWIRKMKELGVTQPLHIGIPGPAKMKTLMFYAKICGVRTSAKVLKNQGFNRLKKLLINKPDILVSNIKGPDRLHLFSFGGLLESSKWLSKFAPVL